MADEQGSRLVASTAIKIAITSTQEEEAAAREAARSAGIKTAAANFGGEFISSINKIIERAIVAARREAVIGTTHLEEGAIAGAAREALSQIMNKAIGLNIGGKIAIARKDEHVSVAMFFGIGLLHLNEVAVGLGHRAI
jgi:fructose-specific phosphotransferase system IIC component